MMQPGLMIAARYDPVAPQRSAIVVERVDFFDWLFVLLAVVVIGVGALEIRKQKKR